MRIPRAKHVARLSPRVSRRPSARMGKTDVSVTRDRFTERGHQHQATPLQTLNTLDILSSRRLRASGHAYAVMQKSLSGSRVFESALVLVVRKEVTQFALSLRLTVSPSAYYYSHTPLCIVPVLRKQLFWSQDISITPVALLGQRRRLHITHHRAFE